MHSFSSSYSILTFSILSAFTFTFHLFIFPLLCLCPPSYPPDYSSSSSDGNCLYLQLYISTPVLFLRFQYPTANCSLHFTWNGSPLFHTQHFSNDTHQLPSQFFSLWKGWHLLLLTLAWNLGVIYGIIYLYREVVVFFTFANSSC